MLLHLSDLHFGTEQADRVVALQQFCRQCPIELVVVSGDLTQRARYQQFFKCRQFLQSLNLPYLVVPGNHDIPLYHLWRRFMSPFSRYQLFFGDTEQIIQTKHFFVIGVNSIRPKHHTKGYVSKLQIQTVDHILSKAPAHLLKYVAIHQPFYNEPFDKHALKDRPVLGEMALRYWANSGLNGLLHGHLHHSAKYNLQQLYGLNVEHPVWDIHAGTALSYRLHHGQQNGFNLITPDGAVLVYLFNEISNKFEKQAVL
ncbi:3',5'-cyclic-nucleotide phosphodiesterase [Acinetobacter qingfengensis]|uniref:3',5'-cyclic-nucleotide phosphodiesterase n=1 Tax=Acinetobacter qingfengensis TaxID=1262585 RepID=A0A1E7R5N1_9GAMM|nr:metallophosphoesterase [Acinetobacter qingfengensis]KAA8735229.1 3',5'-cyclic-nucleotide phosphodiesterase [Acinetobacter qingfengensis]OEY94622.1 3',5'-cyclic-nucleotide phosphodiesterase [Acinetobacter qingfengensis]